ETYGPDLVVLDFGTATTFDVVDSDGAYVGGVIAPGINLSIEALKAAAAHLPHIDVTMPERVVGTNTVTCMQSGAFWGYTSLSERPPVPITVMMRSRSAAMRVQIPSISEV
ncbi:MAG: type III pantothenate kinase, partial [Pseudomonadota bacterium]